MAEELSCDKPNAEPAGPEELADDLDDSVLIGEGNFPILTGDMSFDFAFSYCGVPFRAHVHPHGGGARMRIAGDVAPLPYSAECQAARREILDFLRNCREYVWGECGVTRQQRIVIQGETALPNPVTPVRVVSEVTNFVLAARPFLKNLADKLPLEYYAQPIAKSELTDDLD